mgnify:CR=1 FL=1
MRLLTLSLEVRAAAKVAPVVAPHLLAQALALAVIHLAVRDLLIKIQIIIRQILSLIIQAVAKATMASLPSQNLTLEKMKQVIKVFGQKYKII